MTDQFPDATKMVLSPAAQAVMDAYKNAPDLTLDGDPDEVERRLGLAAALRAAAGYMFPNDTAQQCYDRILAIADELEAHG